MELINNNVKIQKGLPVPCQADTEGREKTIAYRIFKEHNSSAEGGLSLRFDALISHDITYVGVIQTASASGLKRFPVPYILTNCHNSLCAVGGTINADDHAFGLSAAKKFGGIYVPANMAVIHQYAREAAAGCGKMILGSDSHTRYGALGTMGVGEGGPEIVRQLLGDTYDIAKPGVVLVWLEGSPRRGVGPHDVAIAMCGEVYKNGFVKNKVLEFAGPGVAGLDMDFRFGVDVMTTETTCLSSVWITDEKTEQYLTVRGRGAEYRNLELQEGAVYDAMIKIDLGKIEPMVALPFHPSEAFTIDEFRKNPGDMLREAEKRAEEIAGFRPDFTSCVKNGVLHLDQGVIAGCAGGMYSNMAEAAAILDGGAMGDGRFSLSVYPSSIPVSLEIMASGVQQKLLQSGAVIKPCFCGPCFGAGDVPKNNGLSIRHTTRNFPNREGSRPGDGQLSAVMLMDSRSIAATARNGGVLTPATEIDYEMPAPSVGYDDSAYKVRVYQGFGKAVPEEELALGPNIVPWPEIPALEDNLLLKLASVIHDEVTTTDELIPSGETSSYRSNPMKLATFALSRRDPQYVSRAKDIAAIEANRRAGNNDGEIIAVLKAAGFGEEAVKNTAVASCVFARRPGDGSAREQAASCQRVLGGGANICYEFATKRYRSNCINWGMMPFTTADEFTLEVSDYVFVPGIRAAIAAGESTFEAYAVSGGKAEKITLSVGELTQGEREILLAGCLMNWYKERNAK
ncbi:MAG: hydratase [Oscillospiraceae bacterium]|nr:hydratase [Oscillospiraceae bacterium]